ncbi:hypothetical protein P280DRAFT_311821 [Massarina eburnea CBS 473.64]|uniref:polynucleotide adenylyltransferase n=1 Tax=Massarina eburnea CBS 473.64 TaxID=1395130 RepID=A0A6A6S0L8_9PLEO|nr:hypothetical protein P280DRAFT_311821 [Massarina eburnea CBS 473.64]
MTAANGNSASAFTVTSYQTALCVLPPQQHCRDIDSLRALYDKSYGKWPPHINVIYPFVPPEHLPRAKEQIENALQSSTIPEQHVTLNQASYFKHRNNNTIFLRGGSLESMNVLHELRAIVLRSLGQDATSADFHLTIGQSEDATESSSEFLLSKARLIPTLTFEPHTLVVLVRERTAGSGEEGGSQMRFWGSINVSNSLSYFPSLPEYWLQVPKEQIAQLDSANDDSDQTSPSSNARHVQPGTTYQFDAEHEQWSPVVPVSQNCYMPSALRVSSYNVLIDSEHPPAHDRDSLLVNTILSESALADVLVLEEVSDDFLSYLLVNEEVRKQYPFTSHGPPSQANIGPLPSLRNVTILSKWNFDWEFLPFHRRHKGAVVASIPRVSQDGAAQGLPFIVAGVHLTCGLTDGSVAAKKTQLQNLTSHLQHKYADHCWIVAGDFNITTSRYTIDEAVKNKAISQQTERMLESMELMLTEAGLLDTWVLAKVEGCALNRAADADDLFDGEEGATFNPRENTLAAATSGSANNRPQRYDRILVRSQGLFSVTHFNDFGLPGALGDITAAPSDHTGIRSSFKVHDPSSIAMEPSDMLSQHPVVYKYASAELSRSEDVAEALRKHSVFPSIEEEERRKEAFAIIEKVILGLSNNEPPSTLEVPMVMVPVGSYALGVWTTESDIDCLCIGAISSKTFFQLARQRIHKAESQGVRLLRKVEASTGTMLELSVNGISMDLQYCPGTSIVERWSDFPTIPSTDPMFNLPILSLRKLKPIRDLAYVKRTLPSAASFRLAYYYIKLWATERGIYSGKFGFLSGTHVTLMLVWVTKRLTHDNGTVSAGDLIVSFFHHYANFDWENDMVYDAFFHKRKPRYQRSAREPMAILGYHAPNSNIAHTATAPGLQIIVTELKRAYERLSTPLMTWDAFFECKGSMPLAVGAKHFLSAYEKYVKIDMQYWGRTLSKGKGLVGWVESRCINLVVDIHKALPHLSIRVWPARFAGSEENETGTYYHGCYLIGLSRKDVVVGDIGNDARTQAKQSIQKVLDRFLTQVQTDDKYYDAESCWIDISLAKANDVKDMTLDDREWGDYVADNEPDDDDEEASDPDELPTQPSRKLTTRTSTPSTSTPVSSSKLRPASDILNRLRWDPNLDPGEFIVGYEDRFLGAKETSLGRWKTEQTDEEFIPQHRILYFKKSGDEEIVWERATRIDKIFGSGVGSG